MSVKFLKCKEATSKNILNKGYLIYHINEENLIDSVYKINIILFLKICKKNCSFEKKYDQVKNIWWICKAKNCWVSD